MVEKITIEQFKELLPSICDSETAPNSKDWTPENHLWGHCAVVSLVAQNLFGGELLYASLKDTEFTAGRSHYWNRLPDGREEDFTKEQFGDHYPKIIKAKVRLRSCILSHPRILNCYDILTFRLAQILQAE